MSRQRDFLLGGGSAEEEGERVYQALLQAASRGEASWTAADIDEMERAADGGYALPQWAIQYLLVCDREREKQTALSTGRCGKCGYLCNMDTSSDPPIPKDHTCAPSLTVAKSPEEMMRAQNLEQALKALAADPTNTKLRAYVDMLNTYERDHRER